MVQELTGTRRRLKGIFPLPRTCSQNFSMNFCDEFLLTSPMVRDIGSTCKRFLCVEAGLRQAFRHHNASVCTSAWIGPETGCRDVGRSKRDPLLGGNAAPNRGGGACE